MKKLVRNISILLIALLFACCMVVGLAACGDDDNSSSSSSVSPSDNKFEAEWTDISDTTYGTRAYRGYSIQGKGITQETGGSSMNCSNGYYMADMYIYGSYIFFSIYSDAEVEAELYANLSMDFENKTDNSATSVTLNDYQFTVVYGDAEITDYTKLNPVEYGEITYSMRGLNSIGTHLAFQEYDLGTIELIEGWNVIIMMTTNNIKGQGGTMSALAPLIDYIRLDTTATLTWSPVYNV